MLLCPCVLVHWKISPMSLSLLPRQCPACLVGLSSMVCVIGGKWQYNWSFLGCCFQDLFKTARRILIWFISILFSKRLVRVQVVQPYSSTDTAQALKNSRIKEISFIWSVTCQLQFILYLCVGWHPFQSMRYCYQGVRPSPQRVSWIWHWTIWCWGSSFEALGNVEYYFTAITPRSTLTRSASAY